MEQNSHAGLQVSRKIQPPPRRWHYLTEPLNFFGILGLIVSCTIISFGMNFRCNCFGGSAALQVLDVIFFVLTITFEVLLAFTNPGFIPKNTRSPKQSKIPVKSDHTADYYQVVHKNSVSLIKHCQPCQIYRPPRAFHCSVCEGCVQRHDHHCPWVGTCIGRNNYRLFFGFIVNLNGHLICTLAICFFAIFSNQPSFGQTMRKYPLSIPLAIICIGFMAFTLTLLGLHTYLITTGQTTNEMCKQKWDVEAGNPHRKGCLKNWFKCVTSGRLPGSQEQAQMEGLSQERIDQHMYQTKQST